MLLVFPANLNVALNNLQIDGYPGWPFYQWARLPIQAVLIRLTVWATRPARRAEPSAALAPLRAA